ncbi:hypothetical protein [Lentzea sp. NPDC092896]|uniref:hypothetical protein n=1 Tax=Lentzea sp. NPDC092896 TaxID=3364127 RepID=UPI00382A5B39
MHEATTGAALIAAERARQIREEGHTPEHDAGHAGEDLAIAACCYALPTTMRKFKRDAPLNPYEHLDPADLARVVPVLWPWTYEAWKPSDDRVRELAKAGALIAAEIDRLQPAPAEPDDNLDDEPIHRWFGLSYSNYLVVPRTLLQSMPGEWQREFVHLLEQLHAAFRYVDQTECYEVVPGTEAIVNELSTEQRKQLGITCSTDDMTDEQYEAFLDAEDGEAFYADKDGRPLDAHSYIVIPGAEEVPPYNRGRTHLEPDLKAYASARFGLEDQ